MNEDIKLLPCPFCGLPPAIGSLGGDKENWAIWCVSCGIPCAETGLNGETKEEIIDAWNKRAIKITPEGEDEWFRY